MPKLLEIGPIRLAVLDGLGNKAKTLVLPPPNAKNGLRLSWDDTGIFDYKFENGGQGTRAIERPHIPKLVVAWGPYPDLPDVDTALGLYPIGNGNMQRPTWEQLVELTSSLYWGRLRISPGMSAGGFDVSKVDGKEYGLVQGTGYCEQLELTFYGTHGRSTKTLDVF